MRFGYWAWLSAIILALVLGVVLLYAYRANVPPASQVPATLAIGSPTASVVDVPLPGADRFALVVDRGCSPPGPPPYVRREDKNEVIATLGPAYLCQFHGATSPDGRRLAYWLFESGRSEIALYQAGASTTVVRLGEELVFEVVWSSDGTGLLYVAMKGGVQGVPPEYAALRTVDLATGTIRELSRETGRYLTPLAWDRARRLTAASVTPASGGAGEYLTVTEDRVIARHAPQPDVILQRASPDAAFMVAARTGGALLYWPIASFADQKALLPEAGTFAGIAAWRPGARELAVVVTDGGSQRIELWSLDGKRRRLVDFSGQRGGLFFRPDGSALFIGGGLAVDVATGRATHIALVGSEGAAASVLR